MTPDQFAEAMRQAAGTRFDGTDRIDREAAHVRMDEVMTRLLRSLGYGAGVDVFEAVPRYYA